MITKLNENDYGVIGTVSVPLGGTARKSINKALETRLLRDNLSFEAEYASACANVADGGFIITKDATTLEMLKNCDKNITKVALTPRNEVPPLITPPVVEQESELSLLKKQNEDLRKLIEQLMADKASPVIGSY